MSNVTQPTREQLEQELNVAISIQREADIRMEDISKRYPTDWIAEFDTMERTRDYFKKIENDNVKRGILQGEVSDVKFKMDAYANSIQEHCLQLEGIKSLFNFSTRLNRNVNVSVRIEEMKEINSKLEKLRKLIRN